MSTRNVTVKLRNRGSYVLVVENESLSRGELVVLLERNIAKGYVYGNGVSLSKLPIVLEDFGWNADDIESVMSEFGYDSAGVPIAKKTARGVTVDLENRGVFHLVIQDDETLSPASLRILLGNKIINPKYICCDGSLRIENLPSELRESGWSAENIRSAMMQLGYDSTGHRFFNRNNAIHQSDAEEPKTARFSAASNAARKRSTRKRTNDPEEEIEESSRSERELQLRAQFGDRFWNRQGVMPIGEVLDVLEGARKSNSKKTTRVDEPTTKNPSPLDQLKKYASLDEEIPKNRAPLDEPTTLKKHAPLDEPTKKRAIDRAGLQIAEAAFNKIVESPAFKARVDAECEKRVKASIPDAEKRVAQLEKQVERIERRVEAEVKRRMAAIVDAASTYVPPDFVWAKDSQE